MYFNNSGIYFILRQFLLNKFYITAKRIRCFNGEYITRRWYHENNFRLFQEKRTFISFNLIKIASFLPNLAYNYNYGGVYPS